MGPLKPEGTYLFRVPYYDFLIWVLKKVGYFGVKVTIDFCPWDAGFGGILYYNYN